MSLSRLDSFQSLGPGETTSYGADRTPHTVPLRSRRRNPSFVADGVRWHHVTPMLQIRKRGTASQGPGPEQHVLTVGRPVFKPGGPAPAPPAAPAARPLLAARRQLLNLSAPLDLRGKAAERE